MTAIDTTDAAVPRSAQPAATGRYWEIDAMRGVVIITMIIYHLMFDLVYFRAIPYVTLHAGFWKYFQRFTATTFILLAGVSMTVVARRYVLTRGTAKGLSRKFFLRGLKIFAWGMVFVLVLFVLRILGLQNSYVHFGVLHLIGFSIMVSYPLLRFRWLNLAIWAVLVVAGSFLQQPTTESLKFVWLGFFPPAYYPFDYFPVIPWFGVFTLGIFVGNTLYSDQGRNFFLPDLSHLLPVRLLSFLGRHSLVIYLIHQPILYAILFLFGIIDLGL